MPHLRPPSVNASCMLCVDAACRNPSLAELCAARRRAAGTAGRCDRDSMCKGPWECDRWDGEVTLEELRGQQPAPLFYVSVAFLVSWMGWCVDVTRCR
jgi:hypothetical protein